MEAGRRTARDVTGPGGVPQSQERGTSLGRTCDRTRVPPPKKTIYQSEDGKGPGTRTWGPPQKDMGPEVGVPPSVGSSKD